MNHTTKEPKSLQLAVELDYRREYEAAHELRTMQALIAKLEAQLYAISTVEVGQSIQPPVQADTEAPLRCDVCGVECANPWHFSTETKRHKHACDACWGRMMIPGQVGELDHTTAAHQEPVAGARCKIIYNCKSCQHSAGRQSCILAAQQRPVAWKWRYKDGELSSVAFDTREQCERNSDGVAGEAVPLYAAPQPT